MASKIFIFFITNGTFIINIINIGTCTAHFCCITNNTTHINRAIITSTIFVTCCFDITRVVRMFYFAIIYLSYNTTNVQITFNVTCIVRSIYNGQHYIVTTRSIYLTNNTTKISSFTSFRHCSIRLDF